MTSSSSSSPEISAANGADHQDRFSYKHATHEEVLEDLSRYRYHTPWPSSYTNILNTVVLSSIYQRKNLHRLNGYAFRWNRRMFPSSLWTPSLIMYVRHWFYEDFIREENPKFPSLPLKKFSAMLFHACPLLHQWSHDHEQAFNTFMQYKTRVPVCGAIMLNDTWEKVCTLMCCVRLIDFLANVVRVGEGVEVIIWLGVSKGQNQ